ncbi:uncharacterized protein LOC130775285 [Actinidia eriantha]|uniref:uncharacterized protein LOC130775285 n=1 Tax=Actinidia eriantha TaxID=165200 RepID=UPI0025842755|nr:uncharacterized protein LOC130775285 [Actinidia eriantha]
MDSHIWEVIDKYEPELLKGRGASRRKCLWSLRREAQVVKKDIMAVFDEVHADGDFEKSLKATFIVLVPKKNGALEIGDYRPISLIGCIYKVLTKVLARRMAKVMDGLISENQNAFVGGRQILDVSLVANECVDVWIKSKVPGVICKLDIEKAYDHVSWDFLFYLLERLGFGEKWCSWIKNCVSSVKFSMLLNGTAKGFFDSLEGAVTLGRLSGFKVGAGSQEEIVSHLMFADGTLIFCKADVGELDCLRDILLNFQAVFDLKINLRKSELIQVGEGIDMRSLVTRLGCNTGILPFTYLPPLGLSFKSKVVWGPVVDRVKRRLASWKRQYLSKGGKLTLIKSSLSSMPTYLLSLFTVPKSIAMRLEKLMRDFLWKGSKNDAGIHLVAWKDLCFPKKGGGLGVRDLVLVNKGKMDMEDALVADCWSNSTTGGIWAPLFRRGAQDWEMEAFEGLFRMLQEVQPISHDDDKWKWKRWAVARGAILTIDNLRRRKIVVTKWCYMCKRNVETTDHLLIHCDVARELWRCVYAIFGVQWVMPGTIKNLFVCWSQGRRRGSQRLAWRVVPLCLCWSIWRERNLRAFEDIENSLIFLKTSFISLLSLWMRKDFPSSTTSLIDFLEELHSSVNM